MCNPFILECEKKNEYELGWTLVLCLNWTENVLC